MDNKKGIYKLNKFGEIMNYYKNVAEAVKIDMVSQSIISRQIKTINECIIKDKSIKIRGEYLYVKETDYDNHKDKLLWLLNKEDILVIDKKGAIVKVFKNVEQANKYFRKDASTKGNINLILNKQNRDAYGYRFITKYHYLNMIKEDILYYHKEYNNTGGLEKIPVDMYHMDKGYIRSFKSLTDAANFIGYSKETIRLSIKYDRTIRGTNYYFKKSNII